LHFGAVEEVEGVVDGVGDLSNIGKEFALDVWLEGCDKEVERAVGRLLRGRRF
jgi:hypothetical protein